MLSCCADPHAPLPTDVASTKGGGGGGGNVQCPASAAMGLRHAVLRTAPDSAPATGPAAAAEGVAFKVGDGVSANYRGEGMWYKGTVAKVNANGTYKIAYDDGDSERSVGAALVRSGRRCSRRLNGSDPTPPPRAEKRRRTARESQAVTSH